MEKEHEKYLRLYADFENYKKRMEKELTQVVRFANERILLEIADVLDAIDRSSGEYDMGKLLEQILKKHGMTRIETAGQQFDPTSMEAVHMVEGGSSHQVKEEIRAGYRMHDRIIRPARVIVYQ
jgi:molecular chaperone GrpE